MFVQGKHEFYVFAKNKDDKVDPALCKKNAITYNSHNSFCNAQYTIHNTQYTIIINIIHYTLDNAQIHNIQLCNYSFCNPQYTIHNTQYTSDLSAMHVLRNVFSILYMTIAHDVLLTQETSLKAVTIAVALCPYKTAIDIKSKLFQIRRVLQARVCETSVIIQHPSSNLPAIPSTILQHSPVFLSTGQESTPNTTHEIIIGFP